MRMRRLRPVVVPLLWTLTVATLPAAAIQFGPGRPLRLEGYFGPRSDAPDVLGEITISSDGRDRRMFGVTALQAYAPAEEGAQVLRPSTLRPVTLLLRGTRTLVERFFEARPDEKVVVYGVYLGGPGTLALSDVEVAPRETNAGR